MNNLHPQNNASLSVLSLVAGELPTAPSARAPYLDALALVRGNITFCGWAFVQAHRGGMQGRVCAVAGRHLGLRYGQAVNWPRYWHPWLTQGQIVQMPDTQEAGPAPDSPLVQLNHIRSYVMSPVQTDDGQFHGVLLGFSSVRRSSPLRPKQLHALRSASRLLANLVDLQTQLLAAECRAAHMLEEALKDELTGVCNRRGLEKALHREAESVARHDHEVTVLFIDLDGLKKVNDQQGHNAGDALIRNAARALACAARSGDTVGRLGGDELVVVLPHRQSTTSLEASIERFTAALRAAGVAASIGAASTEEAGTVQDAVALADQRMLAQKRKMRRRPPEGQTNAAILPR